MRDVFKPKPSELLVDAKLGTVADALKDMPRTENDLNKFEKQTVKVVNYFWGHVKIGIYVHTWRGKPKCW